MTDLPAVPERLKAALEGRYDLIRELGQGGMATVYLADDLKHKRKVAVKVLKPELAAVVGADRFLTEIETTANLQHPHILPLHDSGEADGFLFYVMPYVDGETLRQRLDRERQLPVDEGLRIATDMAEALDYAHRAGVIHRDIKPANVLMHEGRPLIADFGIALAVGGAGGARLTETGLSVGTPFYMSPEQATGDQVIGAAADTYSLGCVLYEMLVGEPPYPGATAQAVLGKIIAGAPVSATAIRSSIPANVDAAIRKALEKLPADRFKTTGEFAKALAEPSFRHGEAVGAASVAGGSPWKRNALIGWSVAAVAVATLGVVSLRPDPPAPVLRYSLGLTDVTLAPRIRPRLALSPNSERFVYTGPVPGGADQLWLRDRSQLTATAIPGTQGPTVGSPFFSPDGERVAYYTAGPTTIWVVSLSGGPPLAVADSGIGYAGASWGVDGYIYADGTGGDPANEGIMRVPATGGALEIVTVPDTTANELAHKWTTALPNGKGVLFSIARGGDLAARDIAVLDLASGEHRVLVRGVYGTYSPSGHLVYVTADGTLMAATFDQNELAVTGDPVAMVQGVRVTPAGVADLAVSNTGTLMYTTGSAASNTDVELVWVTRQGGATPVDPDWTINPGDANRGWALSPDGSRIVLRSLTEAGHDIWVKELPQGPLSRLTFDEGHDRMPQWTADGQSVTFLSNRGGNLDVWVKRADGTGEAQLVVDFERTLAEAFWSPDEEWLLLRTGGQGGVSGGRDVLAVRPGRDSVPVPLLGAEFDESAIDLSPDGRWLAYQSNETGSDEVFVRPFPDVGSGKWQISTGGGLSPLFAHSGRELFYVNGDREMVAAQIETEPGFRVGERRALFRIDAQYILGDRTTQYDVSPDDEQFLMARVFGETGDPNQLIVVENWFEELKARVGS
jgi:serine/threonine-protein kinase